MFPFFNIGRFTLPSYGAMVLLGILLSGALFFVRTRGFRARAAVLALLSGVCALLGAKLLYFATMPAGIAIQDAIFYGFVFYGGLLGGLLGAAVLSRLLYHESALRVLDAAVPCLCLGHGIGRIGCFLAGCCYGFALPKPFLGMTHFPVQPLEALLLLMLCALLLVYEKKLGKSERGWTTGLYLTAYSILRFLLEFLRGDAERGMLKHLSTSQWISFGVLMAGLYLLLRVTEIRVRTENAQTRVRLMTLGGLAAVPLEAGLKRDAEGKLLTYTKIFGKNVKMQLTKPIEVDIRDEILALLPLMHIRVLELYACVGVRGEAALTAKLCGALRTLFGIASALVLSREKDAGTRTGVFPWFKGDRFNLRTRCIIHFSTGKVMRVGSKVLFKAAKGAFKKWRTRSKTSWAPQWKT